MSAAYLRAPDVGEGNPAYLPGCTGKLALGRLEAARTVARRRRGMLYRCPACGAWHTSAHTGTPLILRAMKP